MLLNSLHEQINQISELSIIFKHHTSNSEEKKTISWCGPSPPNNRADLRLTIVNTKFAPLALGLQALSTSIHQSPKNTIIIVDLLVTELDPLVASVTFTGGDSQVRSLRMFPGSETNELTIHPPPNRNGGGPGAGAEPNHTPPPAGPAGGLVPARELEAAVWKGTARCR